MIHVFHEPVAGTIPYLYATPALAMKCSAETSAATIEVATTYHGSVFPPRKYACDELRPRRETRNPSATAATMYTAKIVRSTAFSRIAPPMKSSSFAITAAGGAQSTRTATAFGT